MTCVCIWVGRFNLSGIAETASSFNRLSTGVCGMNGKDKDLLSGWSKDKDLLSGWGKDKDLLSGWGKDKDLLSGWGKDKDLLSGWGKDKDLLSGWGKDKDLLSGWGKRVSYLASRGMPRFSSIPQIGWEPCSSLPGSTFDPGFIISVRHDADALESTSSLQKGPDKSVSQISKYSCVLRHPNGHVPVPLSHS